MVRQALNVDGRDCTNLRRVCRGECLVPSDCVDFETARLLCAGKLTTQYLITSDGCTPVSCGNMASASIICV